VERQLDIEAGTATGTETSTGRYLVRLNHVTATALEHAADLLNISPPDMIQVIVTGQEARRAGEGGPGEQGLGGATGWGQAR
jgi:hypothetical protein